MITVGPSVKAGYTYHNMLYANIDLLYYAHAYEDTINCKHYKKRTTIA